VITLTTQYDAPKDPIQTYTIKIPDVINTGITIMTAEFRFYGYTPDADQYIDFTKIAFLKG
jgi:hypothetical protein